MHRRISSLISKPSETLPVIIDDDVQSKSPTVVPEAPLPPPSLKIKRVDYYYSRWSKQWKYRNMSSKVMVEAQPVVKVGNDDPWKEFCIVFVRTLPKVEDQFHKPTFKVVVKSEYIVKACKDVVQTWPGISWNAEPLELDPDMFLTFLPRFIAYRDDLACSQSKSEEDKHLLASLDVLLSWLHNDYRATIATIKNLTSHGEITFDLLYTILVPRSTLIAQCSITGELRAFKLEAVVRTAIDGIPVYQLTCDSVDLIDRPTTGTVDVGKVRTFVHLQYFRGTIRIDSLAAFPIEYHPDQAELRRVLIERGRKWLTLTGSPKHFQYKGLAALKCGDKIIKHNVISRIMVDRATFKRLNANYNFPTPVPNQTPPIPANAFGDNRDHRRHQYDDAVSITPGTSTIVQPQTVDGTPQTSEADMTEEDFLLASTVVHGFSLVDKVWLEFNVQKVQPVDWNKDAFQNLVIPLGRKTLLQSLVEAHHKELGFDDFIKGKGQGLVINLFGPPGVGKTFSAEATSEHVKRPLYVVGAGDLGTKAIDLDAALGRVFDVATTWKAIVLIDEADVFLEQRSLHNLERNAMVAVFLRHLEYYRGIIFLTTNRVKVFDEAFLSRIHLALYFDTLSHASKAQVWSAFLTKAGATDITEAQVLDLATRNVNGRQIKNAARTAHSLAVGRGEKVGYEHFVETLNAMDEFNTQFETIRLRGELEADDN